MRAGLLREVLAAQLGLLVEGLLDLAQHIYGLLQEVVILIGDLVALHKVM